MALCDVDVVKCISYVIVGFEGSVRNAQVIYTSEDNGVPVQHIILPVETKTRNNVINGEQENNCFFLQRKIKTTIDLKFLS